MFDRMWSGLLAAALVAVVPAARAQVDVDAFIRKDKFTDIKLSPTGEYVAAAVPLEDRTALAILRLADGTVTGRFVLGRNTHVADFDWVNAERVVIGLEEKFGQLDDPRPTGELYAINADGSRAEILMGFRVDDGGLGTLIKPKKAEAAAGFLADGLRNDRDNIVISVWPFGVDEPFTRAERMDAYSGRRTTLAKAPVQRAEFTTDNAGEVRFAQGAGTDNVNRLHYRAAGSSDWRLVNDERASHHIETPLGFSEDNTLAYLRVGNASGPDSIVAWNVQTGERREVLRDAVADPMAIIFRNGSAVPVGAVVMAGEPKTVFFDHASPEARLYRNLEAAFPGRSVYITSSTDDGRKVLVRVASDTSPGDFYLFDTVARKAEYLLARREWFDPDAMAPVKSIALPARDGQILHGYLATPRAGVRGLVVMPHGGPFEVFDGWHFDSQVQMLAAAGYAVLQVNFRGSGNYGRAFIQAGGQQWGRAMQDDVTDATKWAIAQGVAPADKVCIYGASYGAYAALMGVAREPDLYRCAAGYVGVYDLPMMFTAGDIQKRGSGETYLRQWLGDPATLAEVSPVNLASRIKVPVFLAAGGEDQRAPILHSRRMESALQRAGARVQTLYFPTEGHGFYAQEHQMAYYTQLLDFLADTLGGARAAVPKKAQQPH